MMEHIDLAPEGLVERIPPTGGARVRVVSVEEAVAITECRMARSRRPVIRSRWAGRRSSRRARRRRPCWRSPSAAGKLQLRVERVAGCVCSIVVIHQEKWVHRQTRRSAVSE